MTPKELKDEIVELRMTELEVRDQLVTLLGEVHRQKLWREWGHASFAAFFAKELGYDQYETRDVLIRIGVILPSSALQSEDPRAQERIERLKTWRKERASRAGLAAFRVLTNRSLLEIAEKNPVTIDALQAVRGMGEKKCAAYGRDILTVISDSPWVSRANGSSPSMSAHSS